MSQDQKRELLEINKQQTEFYDKDLDGAGSLPTRIWRKTRRRMIAVRKELGIDQAIDQLHVKWMGDLTGQRVLDLGCYAGNPLSLYIARNSGEYLGVDLSASALARLESRIQRNGITNAAVRAVDFLSEDFANERFDFIYARAVAHHFKYFELFLEHLKAHLNPGGRVITFDPLQTFWLIRVMRGLYRPFQSDREWEFPFTRASIKSIEKYFQIREVQGVLGTVKWCLPLAFLSMDLVKKYGPELFEKDMQQANKISPELWSSLQITMLLEPVD